MKKATTKPRSSAKAKHIRAATVTKIRASVDRLLEFTRGARERLEADLKAQKERDKQALAEYERGRKARAAARRAAKNVVAPDSETVVAALEDVIRAYREGQADVLNRIAEGEDVHAEAGVTIGTILTLALFGRSAIKPRPMNSTLVVNRVEYEALSSIGAGSVHQGADVVAKAALSWLRADRAGLAAWLVKALPRLSDYFKELFRINDYGMRSAEAWEVRIKDGRWARTLESVLVEPAVLDCTEREFMADDVIRAMSLAWNRKDFPGRAFAPLYPRHFSAA